jgi:cytosine deaminase
MGRILTKGLTGSGVLTNATVPACVLGGTTAGDPAGLMAADLEIEGGKLTGIRPAGSMQAGDGAVDLDGGMVLPTLVDLHTHLDKGHIWPRKPNPDGQFQGALTAVGEDREANWSAEDVRARMKFALNAPMPTAPQRSAPIWTACRRRMPSAGRCSSKSGRTGKIGSICRRVCLFGIDRL